MASDSDERLRAVENEIATLRNDVDRSFRDHDRYEDDFKSLGEKLADAFGDIRELRANWKLATAVGGFAGSLIVLLIAFIATH